MSLIRKTDRGLSTYTSPNKVSLISGGKPFFELMIKLIRNAERIIHLHTYIIDEDETGIMVADALIAAAERGVKVYLLADGYASQGLSQNFIDNLRAKKVNFSYFEPLLRSKKFYFGRRLHHKLLMVDDKYGLVSGRNISNRYNDRPSTRAWLDFAILVEGRVVSDLAILCAKTWNGFRERERYYPSPQWKELVISDEENCLVRMRRNDWVRRKNQVSRSYLEMLNRAETEVTILCSYFIPGTAIRRHIVKARKRGVKVTIILAGMSDLLIAKNAERYMYDWLLRQGAEVYEYQKGILHGKVAVRDDSWMTIGSYNINNISAFASIELNLDIINPGVIKQAKEGLQKIIEIDCIPIKKKGLVFNKNPLDQFVCWLSYEVIRLMFYLFTFYYRQEPVK